MRTFCQVKGRGTNELALLVNVDGQPGPRKRARPPITHLDEDKAPTVLCDKINLAHATLKIPGDGDKALPYEVLLRDSLGFKP